MKPNFTPDHSNRLTLRMLRVGDLEMTRNWRNHPDIRKHFFYDQVIEATNHLAWFQQYLSKAEELVFIFEHSASGEPIGQTSLYSIDPNQQTATFGRFMIGESKFRGRGFGTESLALTCRIGFRQIDLQTITLEVKPENTIAIASYMSVGFTISETTPTTVSMILTSDDFKQHEDTFFNEVS
ncbi:MAG: GNAT family N-acetyltransferase [Planctomycetota bacterium]